MYLNKKAGNEIKGIIQNCRMRLSGIVTLLACLTLVNSTAIEEKEEATSLRQQLMRMMTRISGDMKEPVQVLKHTRSTKQRCMYKIQTLLCFKASERPVITGHFKGAMKSVGTWWQEYLQRKFEGHRFKIRF